MMLSPAPPSNLDHTLLALADPTRRAILLRLSAGEARVTELAAPFAISLNAVSKHIQVLERAELVRRRRVGREHFLSFNRQPLDEAAAWIEAARTFWSTRLAALDELLQAEDRAAQAPIEPPEPASKTPKTPKNPKKGRSRIRDRLSRPSEPCAFGE